MIWCLVENNWLPGNWVRSVGLMKDRAGAILPLPSADARVLVLVLMHAAISRTI